LAQRWQVQANRFSPILGIVLVLKLGAKEGRKASLNFGHLATLHYRQLATLH
jgi:hypothetical protein